MTAAAAVRSALPPAATTREKQARVDAVFAAAALELLESHGLPADAAAVADLAGAGLVAMSERARRLNRR